MGYVLIALIAIFLTWPLWRNWFYRFMQRRAEDTLRKMMGMPSRKEEQRRRKAEERRQSRAASSDGRRAASSGYPSGSRSQSRSYRYTYSSHGSHIIPPEYAVDVEFTEIKEFRQTEISGTESKRRGFGRRRNADYREEYSESQVEDVEFTEIKLK